MTKLEWKSEYAVGVDDVDFEHQAMIELINEVYGQLESGSDAANIANAMSEIHTQIAAHFALEEKIMRQAGYPEYEAHKDNHEDLLDQIRDMMDEVESNPETAIATLNEKLADWFGDHFATFDARLHQTLGH